MWGCKNGAKEHGAVIGNEAVWTKVPQEGSHDGDDDGHGDKLLLGMDLVQLGLERVEKSRQALDVITTLLGKYGQGGPCAKDDPSFMYHNSFLIADFKEAQILEIAGVGGW